MDGEIHHAPADAGDFELRLLGHYRLGEKPARTLEALRIFLRDRAEEAYASLRAGHAVCVRSGGRAELEGLALAYQGQGFRVELVAVGSQGQEHRG